MPESTEFGKYLGGCRRFALAVFAFDPISSNAYATEAIMGVLILLGSGALSTTKYRFGVFSKLVWRVAATRSMRQGRARKGSLLPPKHAPIYSSLTWRCPSSIELSC